jgi:hypothetical protein
MCTRRLEVVHVAQTLQGVTRDVTCVRLPFAFQEEIRISNQGRSKELANRATAGGANL